MVEQLYKKHYNMLYQYGLLVHNDKGKVEDVIQNFFIWSIENPKKFNDIRNFEVFACKVVRKNLVQMLIKENLKKENHFKFTKRAVFEKKTISIEREIIAKTISRNLQRLLRMNGQVIINWKGWDMSI